MIRLILVLALSLELTQAHSLYDLLYSQEKKPSYELGRESYKNEPYEQPKSYDRNPLLSYSSLGYTKDWDNDKGDRGSGYNQYNSDRYRDKDSGDYYSSLYEPSYRPEYKESHRPSYYSGDRSYGLDRYGYKGGYDRYERDYYLDRPYRPYRGGFDDYYGPRYRDYDRYDRPYYDRDYDRDYDRGYDRGYDRRGYDYDRGYGRRKCRSRRSFFNLLILINI